MDGDVFKIEGWTVYEKTSWSVSRVHIVNGEEKILVRPPVSIPFEPSKHHLLYITQEWDSQSKMIHSGEIPSDGEIEKIIDGVIFQLRYWHFESKDFGQIKYYFGTPIR